jgi:predicted peptidase
MPKKPLLLLIAICFKLSSLQAQMKTVIGETDYPFWINLPAQEILDAKAPVIIFLHGRSLSGTNIENVKRYGVLRAIERGKKIPAIVVAPQLASGPWNPDKVLALLEYVQKNYNTDPSRIYVCGMSLGGYGTLHFAGKYPDKITAAVAICGGGYTKDACQLGSIPIWLHHGDKDYIVPISESSKMAEAIQKCNPNADFTFTVVKGGNHGSVERIFHQDDIYNWFFEKTKVLNDPS